MAITFTNQNVNFSLKNKMLIKKWLKQLVESYGKRMGDVAYSFCDDDYILDVNRTYLDHDTYTDIITFDYVEDNLISGDILISIERVADNAAQFGVTFEQELCRVLSHGVLHLLGFKDKSKRDAATMRNKEEEALKLLETVRKANCSTWNTIVYHR
ncbi:MAG: rRNA maturation RNase YbeY [Bacteroidales bacterium]|nr:rRNA maturation RNase YbeY [Bacteroidales bacterium]